MHLQLLRLRKQPIKRKGYGKAFHKNWTNASGDSFFKKCLGK